MTTLDREIELLRIRAQAALLNAPEVRSQAPDDMANAMRLVEELRIYQTELEIQNQDLKAAQLQTELAMRKYKRLFENLPLEGMIIDAQGFIVEANAVARNRFSLRQQTALQRRSVYQIFSMGSRGVVHSALSSRNDLALASQCQLAQGNALQATEVDAHIIALDPESFMNEERLMVLVDRTFERQLAVKHEEISRSEERYRALFDKSKVPMLLIDSTNGRIVRGNGAALRFYGFEADQLQGMTIADINCLTAEETKAEMRLAQSESREHFFFTHRLASGLEVPVEVHSGPIEIDGRTLLYSISHDISARVQAQEQAAASHKLLTNLSTQIPGVIYQFQLFNDGRSCFPYASAGINEIYGVSPAQVANDASAVFAVLHPDDLDRMEKSIAESAAQLSPWRCEYRVNLPIQGERWHSGIAKPQPMKDGSVLWHGFVADITTHKQAELKLADFNRDFEAFLDQTTDFVYFKNRDSRFRFCSQTLAKICGHTDWRDMIGAHDRDVFPPDIAKIYEQEEVPIFAEGKPLLNKIDPYIDFSGRPGFVQTNKWPLFDQYGAVSGIFGISRDVTESRRVQARIQLAANVFTHAREGIVITDESNLIVEVNDAFTRITGYSRTDVVGRNPRMFQSGRQGQQFYLDMWQSLTTQGHWEGEVWNRRKNGAVYPAMLSISAVADDSGVLQHYVALFTDISQLKEHERELEHIASFDLLTGLPNRAVLADRLQLEMAHCLRRRKQLAVVFIDLDGFKQVNDQHGHGVGDELLIALALRMKEAVREGDTLARIGGDEFVAILTGLDLPKDCETVLSRLLTAAAEPVVVSGVLLKVSASIGVTLYPQDAAIADQLVRHADHAMYQAKQSGKNRYHYFDVKDDAEVKTHRESLEEISQGLDRGEFVLYYQPKVNMKTGVVVGLEALIRWQHPVRGLVSPAEFLPEIHGHPISIKLGDWVIHSALAQLATWKASGLTTAVSVNIDAIHLQSTSFVARLQEVLALHPDVLPQQLDLEILETSALEDIDRVTETMRECCALGVGFALDDFGTGYSSLTYFKRLPADLMKIDQSFVIGMIADSDDFVIVEGVVGLAKAFGRSVLAEGVETIAHGELLLALGCELGQGYGIARAMPARDVAEWVRRWRPSRSWSVWNDPAFGEPSRDLMLANIKHRHWIRDIQNYLTGASEVVPPLGAEDCPLGLWLTDRGHARYNKHPSFASAIGAHDAVHDSAKRLIECRQAGELAQSTGGLPELNVLSDALLARLAELGVGPETQASFTLHG
jgi:diguanylate cyclase (GGDEF)-like protein/PAS domain S-box-containing protein